MLAKIRNITSHIRSSLGIREDLVPEYGLILGSGLGDIAERIDAISTLHYAAIPGFPTSSVEGHSGRLIYGRLGGRIVIAMQGRVHNYEGYTTEQVALPCRVLCGLGISKLIVSNAAGGLNENFSIGDIMLITDHINLLPNVLVGPNLDELGPRFVDMSQAYDRALADRARQIASRCGIKLQEGVYLASSGPTYETPAEYRFFRIIGADACAMSTTNEVIVARHQDVRVLGFSLISNIGIGNGARHNSHQDVFEAALKASGRMGDLIEQIISEES